MKLYGCDACGRKVPYDTTAYRETKHGDGRFCHECRSVEPDCTVCNDGIGDTKDGVCQIVNGTKFCVACDREVM